MFKRCKTINKERTGEKMFTAWTVRQFDDCMNISVLTENQMQEQFPEIIDAIGFCSDYVVIVDSQGRHFYPLYIYSVSIG